jgi:hypothetical protein
VGKVSFLQDEVFTVERMWLGFSLSLVIHRTHSTSDECYFSFSSSSSNGLGPLAFFLLTIDLKTMNLIDSSWDSLNEGSAYHKAATNTNTEKLQIYIHATSGIQTHDSSAWAGEDILCLRLHDHWDQHAIYCIMFLMSPVMVFLSFWSLLPGHFSVYFQ